MKLIYKPLINKGYFMPISLAFYEETCIMDITIEKKII